MQIHKLLNGNGTLYGQKPSYIADLVREKLNVLSSQGLETVDVFALPDYHNFSGDGGVKDIIFVTQKATDSSLRHRPWRAYLAIPDRDTLHGRETDKIVTLLNEVLMREDTPNARRVYVIVLTDHHDSAFASGVGGYDGVKNFIICFQ